MNMKTSFATSVAFQPDSEQQAFQLLTDHLSNGEALRFISTDKVVGVLGQYPELTSAVRERDVSTVSALCAKLFTSVVGASNPQ
jgi:hypothetical protein